MALTKAQAKEVLDGSGSVLHNGKLITKPEHLKYFDGTEEEKEAEKESLRARLAELEGSTTDANVSSSATRTLDDSFEELNRHKRSELVETAAAEKVEIGESDTKAQIIEKILANRKSE